MTIKNTNKIMNNTMISNIVNTNIIILLQKWIFQLLLWVIRCFIWYFHVTLFSPSVLLSIYFSLYCLQTDGRGSRDGTKHLQKESKEVKQLDTALVLSFNLLPQETIWFFLKGFCSFKNEWLDLSFHAEPSKTLLKIMNMIVL